jgi:hypothetical protein
MNVLPLDTFDFSSVVFTSYQQEQYGTTTNFWGGNKQAQAEPEQGGRNSFPERR